MAIVLNPIQLPASKMLSTMTSLIGDVRVHETLAPSDIINDLVDSCRVGKVDFGKGIVNTFKVSLQPVKDLSETSTAFTITKPNVAQETIVIDHYKFVPLSTAEVLSRDAGLNGDMIATFMSSVRALLADTVQFYLYDICLGLYLNWTPGQETQTITVPQTAITGLSGADLEATKKLNATEIAKQIRKTLNNMKIKNSKFTDIATYIDANTGEQGNVVTCLNSKNMKIVFNDKFYTDFLADAMASLYHAEKVGEMIPGDNFVLLPEDAMDTGNAKTICWLSHKDKFAIADFYRVTLSILDPSTQYLNSFEHFAYGSGIFKYLPGVKFVIA